jgi:hypothetical protein
MIIYSMFQVPLYCFSKHTRTFLPSDMSACVLLYAGISQHPAHLILHIRYSVFLMTRRIGETLNKNNKQGRHSILIKLFSLKSES